VTSHPRTAWTIAVSTVALAVFGFLWLRPDKLYVNSRVNEALPSAHTSPAAGTTPTGPHIRSTGSFRSLEHQTTGVANLVALADGRTLVRLENFRTSNGPDVTVILSDAPASETDARAFDDRSFVTLGALKANIGNQNYEIRPTVDISKYRSIVIWCRRFSVAFGAAPLSLRG
jgi:hypothetical protein